MNRKKFIELDGDLEEAIYFDIYDYFYYSSHNAKIIHKMLKHKTKMMS